MICAWLLLLLASASLAQEPESGPAEDLPEAEETIAPPPEPPEPTLSQEERYNQLLAATLPEEVRWLETADDKILVLFRPTEAATTNGIVLMAHAAEVPPGWPPTLEHLRRYLPRHGWPTLAVSLPPLEPQPVPQREIPAPVENTEPCDEEPCAEEPADGTENTPADAPAEQAETASSEAADAEPLPEPEADPALEPRPTRAEVIARRIGAATSYLNQQGFEQVILLTDNSSVMDAVFAVQSPTRLQGLILVNLQPQEPLSTAQLETLFGHPHLAVMDIFTQPDERREAVVQQRHRAAAMRSRMTSYHQLRLLPLQHVDIDNPRSFWLDRTRGFMEQHTRKQKVAPDPK